MPEAVPKKRGAGRRPYAAPGKTRAGRPSRTAPDGAQAEGPAQTAQERLQKFLAHAGIASRRAAESLIVEGRVKVNGRIVNELGAKIDPARDAVSVDDRPVHVERPLHFAFHKPCRVLCTCRDAAGRPTVLDYFANVAQRVYTVGRLDWDAEGLIFVTNDGAFAQRVGHPSNTVPKVYVVEVTGRVTRPEIERMRHGVRHEGELLRAAGVKVLSAAARGSRLEVTLHGGRNRHIKRMFEALGHETNSIVRVSIGGVRLGTLKPGKHRRLTSTEIESFGGTT
ncbi:MAG: rRNA pseudouridine synthase [Verrucomicrobia bacterium]|nr:rRNA pseudouridine synthase [Verrucomicrobiota bacterium]